MSVTRLSYEEQRHNSAEDCVAGIKQRLERGWQLADVWVERHGYRVIFRRQWAEGEADSRDEAGRPR